MIKQKSWIMVALSIISLTACLLLFSQREAQAHSVIGDSLVTLDETEHFNRSSLEELIAKRDKQGNVPLIIGLVVPGYDPAAFQQSTEMSDAQQTVVFQAQTSLLDRLGGHDIINVKRFEGTVPYMALTLESNASLKALYADPEVTHIYEDQIRAPSLEESVPLIRAHFAHMFFYDGTGQAIAILDTGVDNDHDDLSDKIISEACYSTTNSGSGAASLCPGGASSSTAANSGDNCATTTSGCDHGTHVAGIAAGVAPDAGLIAIQVFSRFTDSGSNTFCSNANRTSPCTLTYDSDWMSGLSRVFSLRNTYDIASINMSLGGGNFSGTCDDENSTATLQIRNLRDVGIVTVASAGNSSYRNAMGHPGCISYAVSVASTEDDDDSVSSFSNVSSATSLFAPGNPINSTVPGDNYTNKGGTSMSAPHVAGAVAVLREAAPNATAIDIRDKLEDNGPLITDARSGGSITKRRLDVYAALCDYITCDNNDYRTLQTGQTLFGTFNPATDRDHYYYNGSAGQSLTLKLNRTSGSNNPYLELFDPQGTRVAYNNNGGGGVNSLINGYTLQQTGLYIVRARSLSGTGNYSLEASQQTVNTNPVPHINYIYPRSATGSNSAGSFWMRIYGSNFTPQTQVYWNGQLRPRYYTRSGLVWMWVYGNDLAFPWPRSAIVYVKNPTPGGGFSNVKTFNVTFPFLGTSELIQPEPNSSVTTGITSTFVLSWTHPTDSWRVMQNMDLRIRDENNHVAAWIRVVEAPGAGSTYRLLNASESGGAFGTGDVVDEGLPGENRNLIITDTVTLHLAQSAFSGSGQTAVMSPTLTFGPNAVGTYNIEFRVDNADGEVQDDDVLGTITIVSATCPVPITAVALAGPTEGIVGQPYNYTATITPTNATTPVTYIWTPEPASGQGTAVATYNWPASGEEIVFVSAENCGAFAADIGSTRLRTTTTPDLTIHKTAPATAVAGNPITYTLTLTNHGGSTAQNLNIVDTLPASASYVSGGTPVGSTVTWFMPELAGFGTVTQTYFVVTASQTITNDSYGVTATGGFNDTGTEAVVTRIVDAQIDIAPLITGTLNSGNGHVELNVPAGSVFAPTVLTYDELTTPSHPLPAGNTFAQRAFNLDAYQSNQRVSDMHLSENISLTLSYEAGANENSLTLYYWDGQQWSTDGITCTVDNPNTQLLCSLATPLLSEYVLLEGTSVYRLYLPMIVRDPSAEITNITVDGSNYAVHFTTYGFTPVLPGRHVHFFFNTVPPEEAGVPGKGPWFVYGGGSPFTGYGLSDKPTGATQMCVLVANPDHSIQLGSGNCYNLP